MTRIVLISDSTLGSTYRDFPLLDFLPCAPSRTIPSPVYKFLKGPPPSTSPDGRVHIAPYAIRKLEASLLSTYSQKDVAVIHEDYLNEHVDEDTEIIAVTTMDPLGLGPTTMSYYALFGGELYAWVWKEWEILMNKVNSARKNRKAKLVVGGPGVWEFTIMRDVVDKYGIDYIFNGEADDIAPVLFSQLSSGELDRSTFQLGYQTYDEKFRRKYINDDKFITRGPGIRPYPELESLKPIVNPAMKGMVEVMRGCGVGCDFCEVTLRPIRYVPIETITREIKVNIRQGSTHAWLHSDEIWGYRHGKMFEPNSEVLSDLFQSVMNTKGVKTSNPTHGRISIPAAHPELVEHLSGIIHAGPGNWIGIQTGIETGSDSLAKVHMPNKTLPLRIGPDGSWQDIVWQGVAVETRNYWRPAFTLQVGQSGETDEDNWDTVAMVNRLSNSYVDGRPFEFTATPLLNVPLGRIKSMELNTGMLSESMLAVYYASYRHLAKMAKRNAMKEANGNIITRFGVGSVISYGGSLMLRAVEKIARKNGVDIDKVKRYGLENRDEITSLSALAQA